MAVGARETAAVVVAEVIAAVAGRAVGANAAVVAADRKSQQTASVATAAVSPNGSSAVVDSGVAAGGRGSGDTTPETGTPPTRSRSTSSDGAVSSSPQQREQQQQPATAPGVGGVGARAAVEKTAAKGARIAPGAQAAPLPPFPSPGAAGSSITSMSDRRIVQVLAAPEHVHKRLLHTARLVPEILADSRDNPLVFQTELYGSLSLDMMDRSQPRNYTQDWVPYYVNARSDVDFVVELRHKVPPSAVAQRLLKRGPWQMVGQVQVHKFGSTQFTLLGSFGEELDSDEKSSGASSAGPKQVYLDITCIERSAHFSRFKQRQKAFRDAFTLGRHNLEARWGAHGALAFDAYIHLLKAFAAKILGNSLAGFQATCIGLFTLQMGYFRLKSPDMLALSLFEGFLLFCYHFYGETVRPHSSWHIMSYRQCAIDLTGGGRWLPRLCSNWRSELYFMNAEDAMQTRPHERMNVTHSLDPARVSVEAMALLQRAFSQTMTECLPTGPCSSPKAMDPSPASAPSKIEQQMAAPPVR